MFDKIYNWFDERVDLKQIEAKMLNEPIPGGARYAYAFGSCLLFIFALQVVTGITLMFYYAPTADHAYESTQYIINELPFGWFVLSFHFWGSSAMVIMAVTHMSQVFLWGAYKKPRELVWLVGLLLLTLVLGFGFTGYLLPWDQRAYWATTVGVEIFDKVPIVGDFMGRFLKGGGGSRCPDLEPLLCDPRYDSSPFPHGLRWAACFFISKGWACGAFQRDQTGVGEKVRIFLSHSGL